MKICSKCGYENDINASFCNNCGADISGNPQQEPKGDPDLMSTCPACGEPVAKTTACCPHCGFSIYKYKEEQHKKENPPTKGESIVGNFFLAIGVFGLIMIIAAFL